MKKSILILALSLSTSLFANDHCKGTTKKGDPCKAQASKEGFCMVHNPNTLRCGAMTAKKEPCKMVVKVSGTNCRFHSK